MCVYVCISFKRLQHLFQMLAIKRLFLSTLERQLHLNWKTSWNAKDKTWRLRILTGCWLTDVGMTFKVVAHFPAGICVHIFNVSTCLWDDTCQISWCHVLVQGRSRDFYCAIPEYSTYDLKATFRSQICWQIWSQIVEANSSLTVPFSGYSNPLLLLEFQHAEFWHLWWSRRLTS